MSMTIADYKKSLNTITAANQDESERRFDDLLQYIRSQPDPVNVAKWFLEGLAIEMMIPTAIGDFDDPIKNLQIMSQAVWEAFAVAEMDDEDHRQEQVQIVREMMEEIAIIIKEWGPEMDDGGQPDVEN